MQRTRLSIKELDICLSKFGSGPGGGGGGGGGNYGHTGQPFPSSPFLSFIHVQSHIFTSPPMLGPGPTNNECYSQIKLLI